MDDNPVSHELSGYTLLELMCGIAILSILATLCMPFIGNYRSRVQGFQCTNNLKGLGAGVSAYMADHSDQWPQIAPESVIGKNPTGSEKDNSAAALWIAALAPYGISEKGWRCPTIEGRIATNGLPNAVALKRIDYVPTAFDGTPRSAYQWAGQPWFVERGAVHGRGPNVFMTDGRVTNMEELFRTMR